MALSQNTKIVTNGLVFYYDMENSAKSWKGKPTINHAYGQNARTDASYASYVQTTSGTWPTKHPDAIRVYNFQGSEITGYVNTGVTDYTNTYHAIWTLDPILKKPVVTMRDVDGQWKAKSFGLSSGTTPNAMGVGYGDTYTISWLQWTDNIAKSVNAGMYGRNTSGSNGFHDGLSNSRSTSYNTKPYTWQRVYATFTVSTSRNLAAGWSCYMYGHYITRGTVKIADVQIEAGSLSGFLENGASSRSSTEAIVDLTGNNTITATNLTYNSDGSFKFTNASNNYMTVSGSGFTSGMTAYTISHWSRRDIESKMPVAGALNTNFYQYGDNSWRYVHGAGGEYYYPKSVSIPLGTWGFYCIVYDGSYVKIYRNGIFEGQQASTGTADWSQGLKIGGWAGSASYAYDGYIGSVNFYNRALTAAEVQQNFNAQRGRYGL